MLGKYPAVVRPPAADRNHVRRSSLRGLEPLAVPAVDVGVVRLATTYDPDVAGRRDPEVHEHPGGGALHRAPGEAVPVHDRTGEPDGPHVVGAAALDLPEWLLRRACRWRPRPSVPVDD